MKNVLWVIVALLIGLPVLGYGLIRWLNYFPGETEQAEKQCDTAKAAKLKPGSKLKILSWNIQYSGSRKHHFFYDGGKDVMVSPENVKATIAAINKVVSEEKPDIILWQEVDRNSTRTGQIDQLKKFLAANPYACWTAAPYHKSAYLPHPSHKHLRRVDMELVVFSRFPIKTAIRHALPQLNESFFRKAFNLKRAVLDVTIPIEGGGNLRLFDTHFSAFSKGDGTMAKQVAKFTNLLKSADKGKDVWLAAGDLNLLPPGDNPKRLGSDGAYYADGKNPIESLFKDFRSAVSTKQYNASKAVYNTYLPYGKSKADRWIDHVFLSKQLKLLSYKVLSQHHAISDHLPIMIEVELPQK